ncbi:hypothetical protein DFJ77DRAFT_473274 [Powellomyces hirtus]|nr:hypothetical protein DFJ77DRAFT_473274 [Powellomyces hirtus]
MWTPASSTLTLALCFLGVASLGVGKSRGVVVVADLGFAAGKGWKIRSAQRQTWGAPRHLLPRTDVEVVVRKGRVSFTLGHSSTA